MHRLSIRLEDWQEAALAEMARARGVEVEALASAFLGERLQGLADGLHTLNYAGIRSPEVLSAETIEHRLRLLFEC